MPAIGVLVLRTASKGCLCSPRAAGRGEYKFVLAAHRRPSFAAAAPPPKKRRERSADRRTIHCPAPDGGRKRAFTRPARLSALRRGACLGERTPRLSPGRASREREDA